MEVSKKYPLAQAVHVPDMQEMQFGVTHEEVVGITTLLRSVQQYVVELVACWIQKQEYPEYKYSMRLIVH